MRNPTSNSPLYGQLTNEVQNDAVLARSYDVFNRPTGYALNPENPVNPVETTYAYDAIGNRVASSLYDEQVEIVAVLPAATPGGEDEISAVTGRVFVAKTPERFTYDADGNISEYVSASDGSVAAHYDYSPFGETLVASGPLASSFTHRFSTKPWCQTTGFCEYQMRKYRPDIGRWMSRDPAGELISDAPYLFNGNCRSLYDILGFVENITYAGTSTDMFESSLSGMDRLIIPEESLVYSSLVTEIKELVKTEIEQVLKSTSCCEDSSVLIDGKIDKTIPYGGKLFSWSFFPSIISLTSGFPISRDWGPLNYNFYTIGNNNSPIYYKGVASKSPVNGFNLCCYYYDVRIKAKIIDRFDFVPDRSGADIKSLIYNGLASVWGSVFYDLCRASTPTVEITIDERSEGSGCYF